MLLSKFVYPKNKNSLLLIFQDWADLIEYILRKCTRVRTENPHGRENTMFPKPLSEPVAIELT